MCCDYWQVATWYIVTADRLLHDIGNLLWLLTNCSMLRVICCDYWQIEVWYNYWQIPVPNEHCVCLCVTLIALLSRFTNIGDVGKSPYFEEGKLKLKYEKGTICLNQEGPDHMSTVITFECDHTTVCTVTCYYFWMWPQHGTHSHPLLLLNVTTTRYALSTVVTFECDHSTVHTVIHYYFWMWPQHRIRCHLLLLLNVTTARYTPSSFITVECDHSTVHTVILYYCRMRPHHGMHCIVVTLLPLYLTTELRIIIILNEFCVEVMSVYM